MFNIFTTELSSEEITIEIAKTYVNEHSEYSSKRLQKLSDYYNGKHAIVDRYKDKGLSNNKVITNYASYIANFTSSYLLGEPVTYTASGDKEINNLLEALQKADSSTQDSDLALDLAIFGRAFELCYMSSDDKPYVKLARISPLCAFVVYDDTVEQKPVFGVYYNEYTDVNKVKKFKCSLVTSSYVCSFVMDSSYSIISSGEEEPHSFGLVPLIEIYNNGQCKGDFEDVISLIDADNILQSDRINDKEQFVDALLLIKGQVLGDTDEETKEAYDNIKKNKVMILDHEGDASFLTRQFDEASIDVLRKSIVADIHKISCVPDMTDQSFASNTSGVAMKYKLIGLEQLAKTKERFFVEALRYRLQLIQNILQIQGFPAVDVLKINITLNRSLPANELEEAQVVATLADMVPVKRLLAKLSFIDDAEAAVKELEEEKANAVKTQQSIFMNEPIINDEE